MKQVAVLGLGDFGSALVRELKSNNVAVLAVDKNRQHAEAVKDVIEHVVIADITQTATLERLGLAGMDVVVVATSETMPVSILTVLRLKDLGVGRIIAKAENEDHAKVLKALGVDEFIVPANDSAVRLANKISWTGVVEMVELSPGCSVMELAPPRSIVGKMLRESGLRDTYQVIVLGVRNRPGGHLEVIPSPDRVISAGCTLVVFGEDRNLVRLREALEKQG